MNFSGTFQHLDLNMSYELGNEFPRKTVRLNDNHFDIQRHLRLTNTFPPLDVLEHT